MVGLATAGQCRCREGCAACVSQTIIWLCFLESCKSIRCCVKEPKLFGSLQFQRCVNSLSPEYLQFNPRARPLPSSSSFAHSLHIHSLPASSPIPASVKFHPSKHPKQHVSSSKENVAAEKKRSNAEPPRSVWTSSYSTTFIFFSCVRALPVVACILER